MMWNTRYGMLGSHALGAGQTMMRTGGMMGSVTVEGGMMGGWGRTSGGFRGNPTWTPSAKTRSEASISAGEARKIAARWLSANAGGFSAGEADPFPGYYTLHALRGDKVAGMLSVNAFTGAVWYHWWHGRFLAMEG